MPKKIEEVEEVKAEVIKPAKEASLKAYADFEFRNKSYKEGDIFVPPSDLIADANMEDFRRVNSKKRDARGKAFYYEIPPKVRDGEPQILRVVLPVE